MNIYLSESALNNYMNTNKESKQKNFNKINEKFDLIYSFRSWFFKYEMKFHFDFVLKNLNNNGVLLIDVKDSF